VEALDVLAVVVKPCQASGDWQEFGNGGGLRAPNNVALAPRLPEAYGGIGAGVVSWNWEDRVDPQQLELMV
jgi:hypothetical protein